MAAHHDLAGLVGWWIVQWLPVEHVIRLFAERNVRMRIGMDEEMLGNLVIGAAINLS